MEMFCVNLIFAANARCDAIQTLLIRNSMTDLFLLDLQPGFTCSKSIMTTTEQYVKSVQSKQ